jgi:HAD superfamily phosphatase (TIGR01668 family)
MIKRRASLHSLTQADFIAMKAEKAALLIDVDNTLLSPYETQISPLLKTWIETMAKDHMILLCTNNFTNRQFTVGKDLNLPILMRSFKPFPMKVLSYLRSHQLDVNSVIVIGDQALTDVLLAKWLKRPYILIKPMETDKHMLTRCIRFFESAVIKDE